MTPFALSIVNRLISERRSELLHVFDNVHCFDFSGVEPMVKEVRAMLNPLINDKNSIESIGSQCFLPAHKTWFEFRQGGHFAGYLLEEAVGCARVTYFLQLDDDAESLCCTEIGTAPMVGGENKPFFTSETLPLDWDYSQDLSRIYAALCIVNSQKITNLDAVKPHKGLSKKVKRVSGEFTLHPWHKIKLSMNDPVQGGGSNGETFSGKKCLHFCRSHLRIRNGRLERVRSHWRGDPSRGVSQATYSVH